MYPSGFFILFLQCPRHFFLNVSGLYTFSQASAFFYFFFSKSILYNFVVNFVLFLPLRGIPFSFSPPLAENQWSTSEAEVKLFKIQFKINQNPFCIILLSILYNFCPIRGTPFSLSPPLAENQWSTSEAEVTECEEHLLVKKDGEPERLSIFYLSRQLSIFNCSFLIVHFQSFLHNLSAVLDVDAALRSVGADAHGVVVWRAGAFGAVVNNPCDAGCNARG